MGSMEQAQSAAPAAPVERELPIEFRATGGEYFRIWIVNLLLSIVTLGIYSAWAKVRRLRYFYGSTSLDGASFEYHGRPIAILKGRIVVVGAYLLFLVTTRLWPLANIVFIPLFIFGVPWIVVRARLFQMRMTSWRGLRFNFHGTYGGAFGAIIGWGLLAIITLMILWPLAMWKQVNFLLTNTSFGSQRFTFHSSIGRFYGFCLATLGIVLGAAFVAGIVAGIIGLATMLGGGLPAPGTPPVPPDPVTMLRIFIPVMLVYLIVGLVAGAYYQSSFLNATVGGVSVGPHRVASRLKFLPLLGIYFTNMLGVIVTLGLFYPWAKVRMVRYQLANTSLLAHGDLGHFVAETNANTSAVGEEAADFFDIDFGI
jgi:uncharacterized membrane protein YjgN (DUF898 family)